MTNATTTNSSEQIAAQFAQPDDLNEIEKNVREYIRRAHSNPCGTVQNMATYESATQVCK